MGNIHIIVCFLTFFVLSFLHFVNIRAESEPEPVDCKGEETFICSPGVCTFHTWVCDGEEDCPNGRDENETMCVDRSLHIKCQNSTQYSCGNRCVPIGWRCDGSEDCSDGRDEKNCPHPYDVCRKDEVLCKANDISSGCVLESWLCDGDKDCTNGGDESNCTTTCSNHSSCDNRTKCILRDQYCNGIFDCKDGADEAHCPHIVKPCPKDDQLRCKESGKCIPASHLCDGEADCKDGSDEYKSLCSKRRCRSDEWHCLSSKQCINFTSVCNGYYDCKDQSDERTTLISSCSKNDCDKLECSHKCQQTPVGAKCYCPDGYELKDDKKTCQDINECVQNVCQHICYNRPGYYKCRCYRGYMLVQHQYCKSDETIPPTLLIAQINKILNTTINGKLMNTLHDKLHRAVALDYHFQKQLIFFTDVGTKKIYRATYGKQDAKPIVFTGFNMPDGIAVDWIAENIYFTESKGNRVDVASLDGKFRCPIIKNLGLARGIAVDPRKMYLFYTDWGTAEAKIGRCSMDGKNCTALISRNITWPNAITLDYVKEMVYWADASWDTISVMTYNGEHLKVIAGGTGQDAIPHPFAITLYQGFIYVTDWSEQSVYKVDLLNNGKITMIIKELTQPMDIQLFHASRQNYSKNYCKDFGCAHLSLLSYTAPKHCQCACGMGYALHPDGKSCERQEFIIVAAKTQIHGFVLSNGSANDAFVPINGLKNVIGVDYDVKEQMLYFSDVSADTIERVKFDGSTRQELVNTSIMNPDGVAVDWLGRNLYWTDGGIRTISVCKLDGRYRRTLIKLDNGHKPRAIVVHPKIGTMFWSDWGSSAKIEKAYMDGSNRVTIVNSTYLVWPNGLAIDYSSSTLYWVDAQRDNMMSSNFDGTQLNVILEKLTHPFGVDVYNGFIYWDDWVEKKLYRSNLTTKHELSKQILLSNAKGFMEVRAYKRNLVPDNINICNPSDGVKCQQLCLLHSVNQRICGCQDGFKLSNDQRNCVVAPVPCRPGEFQCNNSQCITKKWVCDGDEDCTDSSDELDCEKCKQTEKKCKNGVCLSLKRFCDGEYDCTDQSDETNCTVKPVKSCLPSQFKCDKIHCIPNSWKCDGDADCSDKTDELSCGDKVNETCNGFTCLSSGSCIPSNWRCNGEADCPDNSDENVCHSVTCTANQFRCTSGFCLHLDWRCDGDEDCDDKSDEQNCTGLVRCHGDQLLCGNKQRCISKHLTCDKVNDCGDWSDEMNCNRNCTSDEFNCTNSKCINQTLVCNDINDCGDNSDEHNCSCTGPRFFQCKNDQKCISRDFVCDGENDCGDNSDELTSECGFSCPIDGQFHCPNTTVCISRDKFCDSKLDCPGGEDESIKCLYEECENKNGGCSHICTNSPLGALCSCPAGLKITKDNTTCVDVDECELPWYCSQKCVNTNGSYSCLCVDGYLRLPDRRSCKAINDSDEIPFLIFSNRVSIKKVVPKVKLGRARFSDVIIGLRNTIGVDFDWKEKKLYWTDVTADKIQRANFDGSNIETVVSGGLAAAEGIAVDWIGRNIYWLDMRADKIEVAKLNGRYRTVIIRNIDSPRALQLDPREGYLFWTDWGSKPSIERASMDGSNRNKIITSKLGWPNGMTLDYPNKRVYWVDAKLNRLEFCDYDGQRRFTVITGSPKLQHPFSASIFEDTIFWTDWSGNALRFASKYPGGNITDLYSASSRVMDLHVVHPIKQPQGINHCNKARCSHLCVLKPKGYTCFCPIGFKLESKTCKAVDSFLVYSRRFEIKAISLNKDETEIMVPVLGIPDAIAVDVDYSENRIYWTDVTDDSISRIFVNGSGYEKIIKPGSGLRSPDGIAVDWVAKNIYWTDSGSNVISMARTDGRYHKVVLSKSKYLDQPRGIALYPSKGFFFWTDWGHKSIQRARLDGSDITVLVNSSLNFVNGLTIDYDNDRVYWADAAYDRIESSALDGSKRHVLISGLKHPFGISVFNGSIYWSDWVTNSINKADFNNSNQVVLKSRLQGVMDVCVFNKQRQPGTNLCAKHNGDCPELCLWTGKTVQCNCRRGYTFNSATRKCETSDSFLVYSNVNEFFGISFKPDDQSAHLPYISVTINCYAIDFLYTDGTIFFTDDAKDAIGRVNTDGSGLEYIITTGLNRPHGIAVDWVGRNLYWTDMGTKLIEVSRLNGSHRVPVISTGLDKPRAIALDPANGVMFWTDWGRVAKIQKAFMDGSSRKSLIKNNSQFIVWPNGLSIDYKAKMVYWIDGKLNLVGRMDYNGANRQIIFQDQSYRNGYALTVFKEYLYAAFSQTNEIIRIRKGNGKSVTKFRTTKNPVRGPSDVFAYDQSRQRSGGACKSNDCEQLCLPSNGRKYRCVCASGELSNDGKHCEASSAFLVYAVQTQIRFLYLDPKKKNAPHPPISGLVKRAAVALDFDYEENLIFFTVLKKSIFSVYINGTGLKETNLPIIPDGISVDWMSKQIYMTDALNDKIRRVDYNGKNLTNVISVGLLEPRAIVVMPCESMMFWTDWGVPSIERALLNGVNRRVLVDSSLGWPNGLTVDIYDNIMYWVDARLDRIECAKLDGSDRRVIVDNLPHPFAITVLGSSIFWTDWVWRKVIKADKLSGGSQIGLTSTLQYRPMDIQVFTPERQNCSLSPCRDNGGCSQICTAIGRVRKCSCKKGYKLLNDFWCVVEGSNCTNSQFTCASGQCIARSFICDTDDDCKDKSDELDVICGKHTCPRNSFQCNNGKCIAKRWRCDFDDDCHDNSDEVGCVRPTCLKGQFPCKNGRCISDTFRCDADNDCRDFSDETGCPPVTCRPGRQPCANNSMCIRESWICDGDDDCGDNSDESKQRCSNTTCLKSEIKCTKTGRCIPARWRCDGDDDCGDNSDETGNCTHGDPCKSHDFTCKNKNCISKTFLCDGDNDCGDNSDENLSNCSLRTCGVLEFKCYNTSRCIPRTYVCDGDNDCGDASDEHPREGCTHPTCAPDAFRCDNSICIRKSWQCDHENDCGDGSDERSCTYGTCSPFHFTCNNKQCITKEYRCDLDKDCTDGSDEEGCKTSPVSCTSNQFQCRKSGQCIDSALVCDKINHCDDSSDEKDCRVNECETIKPCAQNCTDTPTGFVCTCDKGYQVVNATKCVDINECLDNIVNNCSHECLNTKGSFKCLCAENYKRAADRHTCKYITENNVQPYLLFTDRYYIKKVTTDSKHYSIVFSDLTNAVALDYDYKQQRIYWSSNSPKGIKSAFFNGTDIKTVVTQMRSSPDGLAVDWVERNLYFCESSDAAIYVSKLNGSFVKKLNGGLKEPRGMAVYPVKGLLYVADWGKSCIFRLGMDGSNLTTLLTRKIGWPNGLTIDYPSKKLFWVDARLDTIEYADMDGGNRRIIPGIKVPHSFAITQFGDEIFWTDWVTKGVHKCHKWSGKNHVIIKNTTHKPMDIKIVHPSRQPEISSKCPTDPRYACRGLCLRAPGGTSPGYRCVCPKNFYLGNDNITCMSRCNIDQHSCVYSLKCIRKQWKCDGEDDCGDNSDEPPQCPERFCPPGRFQCDNHNCTSAFYYCDGEDDCGDSSDERNCSRRHCSSLKFRCRNNRCISKKFKCDGNNDCGDGSDEVGCKRNETCLPNQIQCKTSKECIAKSSRCDGYNDCKDKSDEDPKTCPNVICPKGKFLCSYRCIPQSWVCDSTVDCPDESDEMNCAGKVCPQDKFTCRNRKCIPSKWRCDYNDDCGDGSDESSCTYPTCSSPNFRCKNSSICIDKEWTCDGHEDCSDGSDEKDCNKSCDVATQFRCNNTLCVPKAWRCDGELDCEDYSDEMGCPRRHDGKQRCTFDQFECKNSLCLNKYVKCDGFDDCRDNSDEDATMCDKHSCSLREFRCSNVSVCIPSYKKCDGERDCRDNSDETTDCITPRPVCTANDFKCLDGGGCIPNNQRCDQKKDCNDGSDETKCEGTCKISTFGVCQQNCTDVSPGPGYYCSCRQGFHLNETNPHFCEDVNECLIFGKCSQKCINFKGGYKCSCFEGYQLSHTSVSHTVCRIQDSSPTVFVPTIDGIRRYSTSGHGGYNIIKTDSKISSVDFLMIGNESFVLWSDLRTKSIKMAPFKEERGRQKRETSNIQTIVKSTGRPTSFAVDWIGNNIYWINDEPSSRTIVLSTIAGRGDRVLVKPYRFEQPKHLVLYLEKSLMFWCSVGLIPKIEVSDLTGGNRKVLVDSRLSWPSGLAVDTITDRLYWCDMKEREIETIFTNGTDRRVVLNSLQLQGEYSEPYFIDVFEDFLYIVTRTGLAFKWNKFGHGRPIKLVNSEPEIGIKIFHKFRQNHTTSICGMDTCSHICIPNKLGPICLCPDGQMNKNNCDKVNLCYQYCEHGICQISNGKPFCSCPVDAAGERCELTCSNHKCSNNGKCVVENKKLQCRCENNTTMIDCPPSVHANVGRSKAKLIMEILIPVVFGLLIVIAVVSILYCRWRGAPSRKFAPFYGSRKASFTYTGMFDDEDEDDDVGGGNSPQFVINDSEVNFANPVYNSLFLEGPSPGDYTEVNRQLIFQDDESRVDFSNPIYDSFYGSNENSELDIFLPNKKQSPDASSTESFGSHDSLRGSMTRLVKD